MIDRLSAVVGHPVSRETVERISVYVDRLRAESARQNLISASTADDLWERHILDSAQLVRFAPSKGASWIDIGSGAGLPGLIIACLTSGPVTLVEPRRLRAEFLREMARALDLGVQVICAKAERVSGQFDVITGRAVTRLTRFLAICEHLSTKKTVWVLPKGRNAESELAEAEQAWQAAFHVEPSRTDEDSKIVVCTGVRARKR